MTSFPSALIVAAGESKRMGSPKQLLSFRGSTLLERAIETSQQAGCPHTFVIMGAHREAIEKTLVGSALFQSAIPLFNTNWQQGMGSSIAFGVSRLLEHQPSISAFFLLTVDQPFITSEQLQTLFNKQKARGKEIVISQYGSTQGPPTLFTRPHFQALTELTGDSGAKAIIKKHPQAVDTLPIPEAQYDLDTPEDLKAHNK